jgi:putative transposase
MKRSRFNEEQIIAILKGQEGGLPTAEVCRRHGISSATFYKWKSKFGGLEVSEARRLRTLEEENSRLKKRNRCSQATSIQGMSSPTLLA